MYFYKFPVVFLMLERVRVVFSQHRFLTLCTAFQCQAFCLLSKEPGVVFSHWKLRIRSHNLIKQILPECITKSWSVA